MNFTGAHILSINQFQRQDVQRVFAVADQMREFVKIADEADDVFTADLLTARIGALEEASWMLSASL